MVNGPFVSEKSHIIWEPTQTLDRPIRVNRYLIPLALLVLSAASCGQTEASSESVS